jgi:hypothetical protein
MRSCVDKEKAGKLSMYEALRACFQERAFCVCFMQKDSDMISGLLKMPKIGDGFIFEEFILFSFKLFLYVHIKNSF